MLVCVLCVCLCANHTVSKLLFRLFKLSGSNLHCCALKHTHTNTQHTTHSQNEGAKLATLPLWQTIGVGCEHVLTVGEAEAVAALEVQARR